MKIFLLFFPSLLAAELQPVSSTLRSGITASRTEPRRASERTTFESFFDIGYATSSYGHPDVFLAAQELASTYNDLIKEFDDPFERRMEKVEILEIGTRRKLAADEIRKLQDLDLFAFVAVIGNCLGCPNDSTYTNQVDQRQRHLKKSGKSSKKSSESESDHSETHESYEAEGNGIYYDNEDPPILPTEEELRAAYSERIRNLQMRIVDVVSLDEVDGRPVKTNPPYNYPPYAYPPSSYREDSTSKSYSSKHVKKSINSKTKASKSSKYEGKGGKKSSKTLKSDKSGKKVKSTTSKKSARPTCPPVEPAGPFTGTFTSYFRSLYALLMESNVGIEDAVTALAMAYNNVAEKYAAEIVMEESFLFDTTDQRRLSFQEAELRRNLQLQLNFFIEVIGFCTGCPQEFTASNQVDGRRDLSSHEYELDCLLPGLPTEEEVRVEYNAVLEELDPPNVEDCVELEEIDRPRISKKGFRGDE